MVQEIPTALAHLLLAGSSFYTAQNLDSTEWAYLAYGTWIILGVLGFIKYVMRDPPRQVAENYSHLMYVHGFLDLPAILTDVYLKNGFELPVSAAQAGSGVLIALIYFVKRTEFNNKWKEFFIPAYVASGAGLMVYNENWNGLAVMGVYGLTEFLVDQRMEFEEKFLFLPDGWRAVGLSIFSFMLPEIF